MSSIDDWGLMVAHENLGELEGNAGNHQAALHHLDRCVLLARRAPDAYRLANALALMAMLCAEEQLADAAGWLREALDIASRQGFTRVQVFACIGLSRLLLAHGAPADALAMLHAVTLQRSRVGMPGMSAELRFEAEIRERAQALLDAYGLATAQARGELLTMDEIASLVP